MRIPPETLALVDSARGKQMSRTAWVMQAIHAALRQAAVPSEATAPGHRAETLVAPDGKCPHPITRRIGTGCGACGAANIKVGKDPR